MKLGKKDNGNVMIEKNKLLLPTRTNIFVSKLVRIHIFYQVSLLLLSTEDSKNFLLASMINQVPKDHDP